jgi:3-dehydroquinate synthase
MQTIKNDTCPIYFNEDIYTSLNKLIAANNYSSIFILTDSNTYEFCLPKFIPNIETEVSIEIIEIEAGEEEKDITTCVEIWKVLTELGADRKSLLLNLGGGVVTDLGGFIASTFKRGIDFVNIPTSLLGMVDAAIGGKNGVDLGNLKNQIGVINLPKMLLIDYSFLETLPQNQLKSGLAEMLKHGLIYDAKYWKQFLILETFESKTIRDLIFRSVEIKNTIINEDLTENGIRKTLNFGHTLGHAIESHLLNSKKPLLHGEAIAIGMILESYLSKENNLITNDEYLEIKNFINSQYSTYVFANTDIENILNLLIHDKKNEYGKVQFVLLEGIGKCKINQTISNELIYKAFDDYKN